MSLSDVATSSLEGAMLFSDTLTSLSIMKNELPLDAAQCEAILSMKRLKLLSLHATIPLDCTIKFLNKIERCSMNMSGLCIDSSGTMTFYYSTKIKLHEYAVILRGVARAVTGIRVYYFVPSDDFICSYS